MESVLVVDDEADILKLISENLLIRGYKVAEAQNAENRSQGRCAMLKKPAKRRSTDKSRKAPKIVNLAARSLKPSDAEAVKGGLPAVQAAREAARRSS